MPRWLLVRYLHSKSEVRELDYSVLVLARQQ